MSKTLSNHAAAAAQIRAYCKRDGIKATVTAKSFAGGSDVSVKTEDLAADKFAALEKFAKQYQYGSFDGMTDYYSSDNSRPDLPQVKFVFCENRISEDRMQRAWDFARTYYTACAAHPARLEDARDIVPALDRWPAQIARRLILDGKVA